MYHLANATYGILSGLGVTALGINNENKKEIDICGVLVIIIYSLTN